MKPGRQAVPWSHDELVIVCGLYFTLPFGHMHARNPRIVEIARRLGRTPASVAMKLVNFASLDPDQRKRGIRGLAKHARADEQVWREFQDNWEQMALHSEAGLESLKAQPAAEAHRPASPESFHIPRDVITERLTTGKARTMQSFFRKVVLAAYNSRCCISGNPLEELLVASHILPWSDFPKERLNPTNGLCLSAQFDRAFDRGLITFDDDLRLVLSPVIRSHLPNELLEVDFMRREGCVLIRPDRFAPAPDFIAFHRSQIFRAN